MKNSAEQGFLKFLELRGKDTSLVYGSIQVGFWIWICNCAVAKKCLRAIAYYEWLKKVIFF